eukprot:m.239671 g.239671  ORF g.239671 m.239671 type:complete len:181 (-) comp54380_c0_seq8:146-688(-)
MSGEVTRERFDLLVADMDSVLLRSILASVHTHHPNTIHIAQEVMASMKIKPSAGQALAKRSYSAENVSDPKLSLKPKGSESGDLHRMPMQHANSVDTASFGDMRGRSSSSVGPAVKKGSVDSAAHRMKVRNFWKPTVCDVCMLPLKGVIRQGQECMQCKAVCHAKCAEQLPFCGAGARWY